MLKKLLVSVAVISLLGCASGTNNGASISVKNRETKNVNLSDAIAELNEQYGKPIVHYRGYKASDGISHVMKELYYNSEDGTATVVVTIVDDDVKSIVTLKNK